jgi:hypothetical protein
VDRTFVYPGELPRVEDFLGFQKQAYYSMGAMIRSAIGPNPGISNGDFAISATGPASMSVVIGTGSIYQSGTVDSAAFGVLGTDSNVVMQQGIAYTPTTLAITAPSTSGYSQYYLVQVGFNRTDGSAVIPPFLNSSNPTIPWNGANNTGASLNTIRYDQAVVSLVAGVAAPTGSQVVPSPSAGNQPLYVILVSNSTTSITGPGSAAGEWYTHPSFPGFPYLEGINSSTFVPVVPMTTFYVSPTGNDSNPGTASLPFATPNGAVAYVSQFFSASAVTINIANGTYNSNAAINGAILFIYQSLISSWKIVGAGLSTIIDGSAAGGRGIVIGSGASADLSNMTVKGYYQCVNNQGTTAIVGTMQLTMSNALCQALGNNSGNTSITLPSGQNLYVNGTGLYVLISSYGGNIQIGYNDLDQTSYGNIVFNTTTTVSYVVVAEDSGTINFFPGYSSWSGAVTGGRCYTGSAASINTGGQAAFTNPTSYSSPGSVTSWIPGTSNGVINMPGFFS